MSIRFIHIRPGVRYDTVAKRLVGAPYPKGGVTIAFQAKGTTVDVTLARCHHRDAYSRVRGRQIAGGRLEKTGPDLVLFIDQGRGVIEQVVEQVGYYLDEKKLAQEAAA